jgi:putative FmdB family regulatory protein
MPLYEYKCSRCGKKFEVIQKFADQPLTVHPDCGGEVEKLISLSSLQFKGTGWYVTDYGRKGSSSGANGTNGTNGKSESKTEGSKAEGAKTEGAKSEGAKSETSKTESKAESKST